MLNVCNVSGLEVFILLISGLLAKKVIRACKLGAKSFRKHNKMDTNRTIHENGLKIQYCNLQTHGRQQDFSGIDCYKTKK